MSCTPNPLIMSPCADDTVAVGQTLGVSGDVNFDEQGSLALEIGQTSVSVLFSYEKVSSDYRFEQLYIKSEDSPVDIRPVLKSQSVSGFEADLSGAPITANCKLYWRVVVPDALQACQTATGGPHYALLAAAQSGQTAMTQDQDYVDIEFATEQPDDTWEFEVLSIVNLLADPVFLFAMPTIVSKTSGGCRLQFQAAPNIAGYSVHWRIR